VAQRDGHRPGRRPTWGLRSLDPYRPRLNAQRNGSSKLTAGASQGTDSRERGSGSVLAAGLAFVVMMAMVLLLLLAQSAVMASRAAAAADLAALAGADALRGITEGDPCAVAAEVAARHAAALRSCLEGEGGTLEVMTELSASSILGAASARARAGPPP
jgi:secretion/DNA translocation related TadE-like protein